jgi:hypothetical protein
MKNRTKVTADGASLNHDVAKAGLKIKSKVRAGSGVIIGPPPPACLNHNATSAVKKSDTKLRLSKQTVKNLVVRTGMRAGMEVRSSCEKCCDNPGPKNV